MNNASSAIGPTLGTPVAGRGWLASMRLRLADFIAGSDPRTPSSIDLQQRNDLVESYNRVRALREQLASAEQLASVGQTTANVAHQVGTPLNLISGYVQLLKEEVGPGSPLFPRLALIEEQIAKVTATVRTLLDQSRHMGPKTRTTTGQLVNRVGEVMRPTFDSTNIRLVVEGADAHTPILVDVTNLELAILNLMTNAVDAMPGGGALTIGLERTSPTRVSIRVADTGHGIRPELLTRIFEPWVSTKKPGQGTGLGLPIARDVVVAHGGNITVVSEIGRGSTFTIELPADSGRDSPSSK